MKGTALQVREGEKESVCMLLSLVAHAVEYKMIIGAHNTVYARRMWAVLPHSPCMENDGAHNIVDAQRHVGGFTVPALSTKYGRQST